MPMPITKTTKEENEKLEKGICPDCGHNKFLAGPKGGLSQNIKCANCDSKFNIGPLGSERI